MTKEQVADLKELLEYWRVLPNDHEFEEMRHKKYNLKKKTLFIGFAETATGLGQGVFSCFKGQGAYLHTTRVQLVNEVEDFRFNEEHSHAVNHRCYIRELEDLESYERVVLIDDEITTGKTALNLIRAITKELPIKDFVVFSLLDWRTAEDRERFERLEEELDVSIQCEALIKGHIKAELKGDLEQIVLNNEIVNWQQAVLEKQSIEEVKAGYYETLYKPFTQYVTLESIGNDGVRRKQDYMRKATGRFGITIQENNALEKGLKRIAEELKAKRKDVKCLCLGTEEFIYIPNQIACFMGEDVYFACSARSPIITIDKADYALRDGMNYLSPEDQALPIYLYNMQGQGYEEVFWFLERDVAETFKQEISKALYRKGIKKVYFVVLNQMEG